MWEEQFSVAERQPEHGGLQKNYASCLQNSLDCS